MVSCLAELEALALLGYTAGLHIRFASPLYFKSTYPQAWQETYSHNNFALRDPLVFWGISQTGATRWSRIALPDPFGVLAQAHAHGLSYGVIASTGKITSRTIVGAARADREFVDDEIAEIERLAIALHDVAEPPEDLDPAMVDALRLIGDGVRHSTAASQLGITESALDARLEEAQERLGAQTTAEALRMAREYRLI
jgi:LuxR family transcriptional regulator